MLKKPKRNQQQKRLESVLPVLHDMRAQIFKSQCILVAACVKKLCELESGHDFQEQEHFKRASNHFAAFAEATALMPLGSVSSKSFRDTLGSNRKQSVSSVHACKRRAGLLSILTHLMLTTFSNLQACIVDSTSFEKRRTLMDSYKVV